MALFGNILLSHMAKNLDKSMQHRKKPVPISYDKEGFKALVDVHQFKEGEVRARLEREKEVVVEACHEEISDSHGLVSRRFSRRYVLPTDCDPAKLACQVSSDGVLIITAPPKNDDADTKPAETAVDSNVNNKTEAVDETCKTDEVVSSTQEVVGSTEQAVSSTEQAVSSTDGPKTEELNGSADDVKTGQPNGLSDENKTDNVNGSSDHEKTDGMNGTSDGKTGEEDGPEDPSKSPVVKQADKKLKLEDGSVVSNGTTEVSAE